MGFVLGFLVGIVFSLTLVIVLLFQILSKKVDPFEANESSKRRIRNKSKQGGILGSSVFSFNSGSKSTSLLDQQVLIDLSEKPPTSIETAKWVNFITSRLLSDINKSAALTERIYHLLNNVIFDDQSKPDYIGKIQFSDINYGHTTPEIGTVKLISPPDSPVSVLEFDLIYTGDVSITVYTELWLNWPQKHTACLPVKTKLSVKQFSGKFILYIPNNTNPVCSLYLKEQPHLSLRMITKMGYETILKEPGKIGSFIQSHLLKFINQKLVSPNKISFNLFQFLHPTPNNMSILPSSIQNHGASSKDSSNTNAINGSSSSKDSSHTNSKIKKTKSSQSITRERKSSIKSDDHPNLNGSTSGTIENISQ